MTEFLLRWLWETWLIFKQASVFLLFGFFIAGLLAVCVPEKLLSRLFRIGKIKSVLWAATVGAPLPLCSCGVVPAALALKRQGATPGATVAFLIATPETGADSVSLTYALMDPLITVFRPIAAVVTALTAGLLANFFGQRKRSDAEDHGHNVAGVSESAALHTHGVDGHVHEPFAAHMPDADSSRAMKSLRVFQRVNHYAFRQLLDDIGYWIVLGILLSGLIAAALPPAFFERYLGSELVSMLVMLLVGVPIYVCASEATPLAAALVLKGLNPGAALVFLLVGPATNIGSLVPLTRFFGARIMSIYLGAIVGVALLAGFALNAIYRAWGIDPRATFGTATGLLPEWLKVAGALLLLVLLALSMRRAPVPVEWIWLRDRFARVSGLRVTAAKLAGIAAAVAALLYAGSGFLAVQPGEVGIRARFGEIVSPALEPGLHYRMPWPFESHRIVRKEEVQRVEFGFAGSKGQTTPAVKTTSAAGWNPSMDIGTTGGAWFQKEAGPEEPFLLTGDGNLIDLRWAVQFRVKDAVAYAYRVAEPDALVRSVALAALRSVAARNSIDAIYTAERSSVERKVEESLQQTLDEAGSGIELVSFQLLYVHPPGEVHDAFRDVASSQEDKQRTIHRANIFAVEMVNQAKADAAAMIEQAIAFKEQQILHAQGDANNFKLKLGAYRRAPELTEFRLQLESIEETLPGLQKFIMPDARDVKDFDMWLLQPAAVGRGK